jgi:hypothetical protein
VIGRSGGTVDPWVVVTRRIGLILVLVLVGGAFFSSDASSGSRHGAKPAKSRAGSRMLEDALVLTAMGQSPTYNRDFRGLLGVLSRAGHLARPSGAASVWRKAPAFVRAMAKEESLLYDRVRTVDLQASRSELCRQVALRYLARTQGAVRDFEIALAQSAPTWATVKQFSTARIEVVRSYLSELGPCIAAAPRRDRKQLADTMLRF